MSLHEQKAHDTGKRMEIVINFSMTCFSTRTEILRLRVLATYICVMGDCACNILERNDEGRSSVRLFSFRMD